MGKGEQEGPEKAGADQDFIWGIHAVNEALRRDAGRIHEVLVRKGRSNKKITEITTLARQHRVRVRFADLDRLRGLKGCHHQGVAARLRSMPLQRLELLIQRLEQDTVTRILVLDSIQDPRNLGSILRSAVGAGFFHVIIPRERSAPLSNLVASASAGAVFHLNLYQAINLRHALAALKEVGCWIFGGVADPGAVSMYQADFSGRVCLVVGSEGKGIRPLVRRECDQLVTIPMQKGFDSLNVSVAAALLMFEVVRQQERETLSQ